MQIDGDLKIQSTTGHSFDVPLSVTQLLAICKILGFKFNEDGTMNCYSDESVQKLMQMKGNPFRLQEKNNENNSNQ